jgi:two-component system sensor histidine kinase QseC
MRSPTSRRSLRRELLLVLLGSVALIWIATSLVSYLDARHELDELLDAHLAQSASLLVAQGGREADEIDVEHAPLLHRYSRRVAFQLWEHGTVLGLHSINAPNTRLSPQIDGFSDAAIDGERWRVFSAWDAGHRYLVQVGERRDARDEIVAKIAQNLLWPLAVALPVLGLLVGLGIARATRPLRLVHDEVGRRAPDNLSELDVGDAPDEVVPLIESLNRLFRRVAASIENERRFTADAAHELRTPLAALRAQAQVAHGALEAAERRRALDNVIAGCDRASHMIDQLLTLARLEPEGFVGRREPCDLHELARGAIAEAVPAALARAIEIELASGPPATVCGDARLLAILLRNVLDNAVRYSPSHSTVRVRVTGPDGGASLCVADEGPGVPVAERERLGRRFHRLPGTEGTGSGLGLSIVKRIAEIHGASVGFAETAPGVGLTVTVSFPNAGAHGASGRPRYSGAGPL